MIEVLCRNDNCCYCDVNRGECGNPYIEIGDNLICESFEELTDDMWGKEPVQFWIAINENGKTYRKLARGRKVTVCGEVFYTRDDLRYKNERVILIDPKTGMILGMPVMVEENICKIRKGREVFPDIMTCPEVKES